MITSFELLSASDCRRALAELRELREHWIEVASPDHPLGLWTARATAVGPEGEVVLRAPVDEGPSEVRFLERLEGDVVHLIGRAPVSVEPPRITLDVPESVILGSRLTIGWEGPGEDGDHLVISRKQAGGAQPVACAFTRRGSPLELLAPSEEGDYVVRYLSGLTADTLATAELRVTHTPVRLLAPDRVRTGGDVVVEWEGPGREGDYLTLSEPGSPSGEYLSVRPTSGGSPAVFTAPHRPGTYDIRYIKDADDSTEGSTTIEVYDVDVRLGVPKRVRAGSRFEVQWQGPDGPGDFISLAPQGSRWQRKLDWAFTSAGSPASLAAPFTGGRYEVRYVSGADSRILESVPVTVEE